MDETTVGIVQMGALLGDHESNTGECLSILEDARKREVRLLVFPEAVLTGYLAESPSELREIALDLQSIHVRSLIEATGDSDLSLVIGLIELDGSSTYNTAVCISGGEIVARYRKAHLPFLGADRFVSPGTDSPSVVELGGLKVGVGICYDMRFPEWSRSLALAGAEVLAFPTNWAASGAAAADILPRCRAYENQVFLAVANRNDSERESTFVGRSQIVDPWGNVMVDAGVSEGLFEVSIDLVESANTRIIVKPGEIEIDPRNDRRPDLYAQERSK